MKTANLELIQNLVKFFSKLERRQKRYINSILKSHGVSGIMYKIILLIKRHPGTSQDFLADYYSVDKSQITRRVRELEKAGYLSRKVNEDDRRYYQLFLTQEGEGLHDIIREALTEWGTVIVKNIPPADIVITLNTIEKMVENFP